jgi:hypothetical protein
LICPSETKTGAAAKTGLSHIAPTNSDITVIKQDIE